MIKVLAQSEQLLPSARSAMDWVEGDKPWASLPLLRDLTGRWLLIGLGLYLATEKRPKTIKEFKPHAEKALVAASTIEVFVILLAFWRYHTRKG